MRGAEFHPPSATTAHSRLTPTLPHSGPRISRFAHATPNSSQRAHFAARSKLEGFESLLSALFDIMYRRTHTLFGNPRFDAPSRLAPQRQSCAARKRRAESVERLMRFHQGAQMSAVSALNMSSALSALLTRHAHILCAVCAFSRRSSRLVLQSHVLFSRKAPCCSFARHEQQGQVEQQEQQGRQQTKLTPILSALPRSNATPATPYDSAPANIPRFCPLKRGPRERTNLRRQETGCIPLCELARDHSSFLIRHADFANIPICDACDF